MTVSVLPASILSLPGKLLSSVAGAPVKVAAKVGLDAVSSWVVAGAEAMLKEVVKVIGTVTTPSLSLSWFSASYWQMAALAMLLTLPFLFAAAVQAVIQTNVGILVRAACVDLPIAAIAVTLAAPLITLMLAATDQMCSLVDGGGTAGGGFLTQTATQLSGAGSGFMLVVIAVVILLAGMVLLLELIMRSAAIYVVVLFLPIGFAAMVWPARRVWVKRMLETLIALILSKFAMVAILSMSVAALASLTTSPAPLTTAFTAMALTVLAACSPWALLRLLPFTELAVSAASTLRQEARGGHERARSDAARAADFGAGLLVDPVMEGIGGLRNFVSGNAQGDSGRGAAGPGRLARSGSGGELPPAPDLTPGTGPGPGGGGGGSAPSSILPAEAGAAAPALTARSTGEGSAVGVTTPDTSRAAVSPDGSTAPAATRDEGSPLSSAPPEAERPPALAPVPAGADLNGETPPLTRNSAEPAPMPGWGPAFEPEQALEFNLAEPGRGFLVPPADPGDGDGDQPEASGA